LRGRGARIATPDRRNDPYWGSIAKGSGRPGKGGTGQGTVEANSRRKEDDRQGIEAVNKRVTHRQAKKIQRRIRL
jgi:hypothetical protein